MPYFCRKLGKMSQNLLSAAVVIGALRVNTGLICIGFEADNPEKLQKNICTSVLDKDLFLSC